MKQVYTKIDFMVNSSLTHSSSNELLKSLTNVCHTVLSYPIHAGNIFREKKNNLNLQSHNFEHHIIITNIRITT